MPRTIIRISFFFLELALLGCGSGGGEKPDARSAPQRRDAETPSVLLDAGACEGSTPEEISLCIINSMGGNGSVVTRQEPPSYEECKK